MVDVNTYGVDGTVELLCEAIRIRFAQK